MPRGVEYRGGTRERDGPEARDEVRHAGESPLQLEPLVDREARQQQAVLDLDAGRANAHRPRHETRRGVV